MKSDGKAIVLSPLTRRADVERLDRLLPVNISRQWQASLGIDLGAEFRGLDAIEYWRCRETGLCWYSPGGAAGGGELYSQLQRFDWYYMPEKWEFEVAVNALSPASRILEIGVGGGHFMRLAAQHGLNPSGLELNPSAAQEVRQQGFTVYESDLAALPDVVDQPFDAVCAFQVLEHVPDPGIFLKQMLALLRPGGRLVLSVPNAAVMRRIDPQRKELLNQPPHHMSHWDECVFRSLEKILPVRTVQVNREPLAAYHVPWVAIGYLRGLFAPLGPTLCRLLFNRITTLPVQWLLYAGLRKKVPGHTLLVVLEHRPVDAVRSL